MARQAVQVEIAFTATPFADPSILTWTDVSSSLLIQEGFTITRGKPNELPQIQAGTVSFVLDNRTGNFDHDNPAGAFFPLVVPEIPVRISSTFGGTTYRLFYGFIESWSQFWNTDGFSMCRVVASDGIEAILAFALGLGYTEKLVSDYGGTIGTEDDFVWPWQLPNNLNSYLNVASANVVAVNNSSVTGVARTALQLSGSGSSFYWTPASIGARGYWAALDGWFRIDTMPGAGSVPKCMAFNGNGNGSNVTPNLGFGPPSSAAGDAMSLWVINYPQNFLAATLADPTTTAGWTATGAGSSIATAAITTANALQRIYLDNGATDFYGATKAMRLTTAASGVTYDMLSPFTNCSASTAYTFAAVLTQENANTSAATLTIDWYNGATFLSSTTIASVASAKVFYNSLLPVTSPATATRFQWHLNVSTNVATQHYDVSQLIAVAGTFNTSLPWYAGGTTPAQALHFIVQSGTGVAPPGQSNTTTGWPCYAIAAVPAAASWFHVAIDGGLDNVGTPFATRAAVRMPNVYVNGAAVRMWTTGDSTGLGVTFNAQPFAGLGVQLYFTGGGTPIINAATAIAMTVDELYIPDANIPTAGEVTAAKALAHYNYGLRRHDFVQQLTGARVNAVLDSLGWPSAQRTVDTGTISILAQLPDTTGTSLTGTSLILDATVVEGGLAFVARDGKFTFWDRAHAAGVSAMTIGDGGGETPYQSGPSVSVDRLTTYNFVTLTRNITDGAAAAYISLVSDATSLAQYKLRPFSASAPWVSNTDMDTLGAAILADYKTPATRISAVSVDGVQTAAFASLLVRDIGDYVTVKIRPRSSGPTITVPAYVQGYTLNITASSWLWTFNLSPTIAGH